MTSSDKWMIRLTAVIAVAGAVSAFIFHMDTLRTFVKKDGVIGIAKHIVDGARLTSASTTSSS
jgi:hypothetical protein